MNTVGNLGGSVAGWLTGFILKRSLAGEAASLALPVEQLDAAQKALGHLPGYRLSFITFAAVYMIAVVLWLWIDATRPVAPDKAGVIVP
jgi:hypothetical protein